MEIFQQTIFDVSRSLSRYKAKVENFFLINLMIKNKFHFDITDNWMRKLLSSIMIASKNDLHRDVFSTRQNSFPVRWPYSLSDNC